MARVRTMIIEKRFGKIVRFSIALVSSQCKPVEGRRHFDELSQLNTSADCDVN